MTAPTATRARAATSTVFGLNGFMIGMWLVNIPTITERTGTSKPELGVIVLIMGSFGWVGIQVGGRLVDRVGSAAVASGGLVAQAALLLGPAIATNTWLLALALAGLGLSNGAIDVGQNAQAVVVERSYGRTIMSAFHALWSAGGFLAALAAGALITAGVGGRVQMLLAGAASLVVLVVIRSHLMRHDVRDPQEARGPRPAWTRQVAMLGLLAMMLMLAEGVAYDWSTLHARRELHTSAAAAAVAYGAFSAAMTGSRLVVDRVVDAVGTARFVRVAALVGAVGLGVVAMSSTVWVAVAGWVVVGVGLAGCVPQLFSVAGNLDPQHSGVTMSRVVGLGYVGMLAGPSIIGLVAGASSLSTAFWLPAFGCAMAGLLATGALRQPH